MTGNTKHSKFDIAISHRNWKKVLAHAFAVLSCASPGEVVCIVGPSRAGKTLLIFRLIAMLCGENKFNETGMLPAIVVEAVNTGPHGSFSTKAFIQRMLEAVKHPLFSMKGHDIDDMLSMQKMDRSTEATLRVALENALCLRSTRYVFIDEAQHVKYASKDTRAAFAVMDSWKCLAQTTGLVIVFVGAYPILDVIKHSPHLLGRKHQIHFPRYYANKDDILAFGQLLSHYSSIINLDSSVNSLNDVGELMYSGSLGCIGLLKAWLKHADALASIEGIPINEKLLIETRLSDADIAAIRQEIETGEALLKKKPVGQRRVTQKDVLDSKGAKATKQRNKPFQRKPKRHPSSNRTTVDEIS